MTVKHPVGLGLLLAFAGAVLAFALSDPDAKELGVRLEPLGGVLLAAGALLVAGGALSSMGGQDTQAPTRGAGGKGAPDPHGLRTISGLIAVVAGVLAVVVLTIVTVTLLGGKNEDSAVAVTTSALGIISAVVGAYLGIRVTAETNVAASHEARNAAVARQKARRAEGEIEAMARKAEDLAPEKADAIKAAALGTPETGDPPSRGG